jgi:DNA-binding Lrp family transcriptional regulator
MTKIDTKDRKIISELDMNARIPTTELAKKVGLSRQAIEYRINRLRKENVLIGAFAVFDSTVVGQCWYRIALQLLNTTKEEKDLLIQYLQNKKEIMWIGEVGGNWDLVFNFLAKDNFEFNKIFEEIITQNKKIIKRYEILIYINVTDMERSYIFEQQRERRSFFHQMKYNGKIKLDELDINIIRELSKNALTPDLELGRKYAVSGKTIRNRIKDLEKHRIILGYRMFINPSALNYLSHMLFLGINNVDLQKEKALQEYLKTIPNVAFIVKHIGRWRIGMEIETKDAKEFQDIFVSIRGQFSDIITDFESFPLFKDHTVNYFPGI